MNTIMRIQFILFFILLSFSGYAQIVEGITYSEDEIAIQDKFVEAKKYTLIGRFEKAEEILKKLYNDDRKNPAIAMELSKVYGFMEDPYNEFKYAKTASDNDPDNEYVMINFANICMAQEKFEESICFPHYSRYPNNNDKFARYADYILEREQYSW